jgi:hypothetical protein
MCVAWSTRVLTLESGGSGDAEETEQSVKNAAVIKSSALTTALDRIIFGENLKANRGKTLALKELYT